jgi:hypothetical protein
MPDLKSQVRAYVERNVERHNVEDVSSVFLDRTAASQKHSRPLRPALAFTLGAILVFGVFGLVGLLGITEPSLDDGVSEPSLDDGVSEPSLDDGVSEPSTPILSIETDASETTIETNANAAELMAWERIPPQDSLGAGDSSRQFFLHAVAAGGPGLIGAGQVRPASGLSEGSPVPGGVAAVWRTADGITWDRVPHDEAVFGGEGGSLILDLEAGGPGFVAVGGTSEKGDAAIWLSEDGLVWSRVTSSAFEDTLMYAVAAGDEGVVAVGNEAIWYSSDGAEWERVEPQGNVGLLNDIQYGDLGFVAVGWRFAYGKCDSGEWGQLVLPVAWVSQNGRDWEEAVLHASPTGEWVVMYARAVMVQGETAVVAGSQATTCPSAFNAPPAFWTSNDGSTWDEYTVQPTPIAGMSKPEARINGLATTEQGLVAVGGWTHNRKFPDDTNKFRAAAWYSTDGGATWNEVPPDSAFVVVNTFPASYMKDLAVLDETLIGVGSHNGDGAVWIGKWTD